MKERPILFSGEMVRAILEWRKTQMEVDAKIAESFIEHQSCTVNEDGTAQDIAQAILNQDIKESL